MNTGVGGEVWFWMADVVVCMASMLAGSFAWLLEAGKMALRAVVCLKSDTVDEVAARTTKRTLTAEMSQSVVYCACYNDSAIWSWRAAREIRSSS